MTINVTYIPAYYKPLWYFQESPFKHTSVWEWETKDKLEGLK